MPKFNVPQCVVDYLVGGTRKEFWKLVIQVLTLVFVVILACIGIQIQKTQTDIQSVNDERIFWEDVTKTLEKLRQASEVYSSAIIGLSRASFNYVNELNENNDRSPSFFPTSFSSRHLEEYTKHYREFKSSAAIIFSEYNLFIARNNKLAEIPTIKIQRWPKLKTTQKKLISWMDQVNTVNGLSTDAFDQERTQEDNIKSETNGIGDSDSSLLDEQHAKLEALDRSLPEQIIAFIEDYKNQNDIIWNLRQNFPASDFLDPIIELPIPQTPIPN